MKKMNDKEFTERLWSNPRDNSAGFLQAAEQDSTRQQARLDALEFEHLLDNALRVPAPSPALEKRLLEIPESARPVELPLRIAAREETFLRRLLPVAAVLLVALGLGIYLQPESNSALAHDLFSHVYAETPYMNPNGSYTLDDVNSKMAAVLGVHLEVSPATEALQVSFVKDCFVASQIAMHLVLHGDLGDVNVMLLPEQVSTREFSISDEQFNGIVAPAEHGTLVVIGNKQEPIREYRNLLSSNLGWEY
jgi:hypothetical protein